jgi:hypothetical protein
MILTVLLINDSVQDNFPVTAGKLQIPARGFSRGRRTILLLPLVAPESDEGGWEKARLREAIIGIGFEFDEQFAFDVDVRAFGVGLLL